MGTLLSTYAPTVFQNSYPFKHGNTFVYSIRVWLFKRDVRVLWIIPHPTIFLLRPSTHLSYSVVELKFGIITKMFDIIPHYPGVSASIALISTLSINSFSDIVRMHLLPQRHRSFRLYSYQSSIYLCHSSFSPPAHPIFKMIICVLWIMSHLAIC